MDNRERIRLRLEAARAREKKPAADTSHIDRINELTRTARGLWFGLLSYLAFVGVTLLGVADADFFIVERQTELPLIGVSIPTTLFFTFAPILGTALYTYLHLHLIKLWEPLTEAPARLNHRPLSDQILPWLVNDFALGLRGDGALRIRPLRRVAHLTTVSLVFLGTPAILAGFWWRSMPAHNEALTVLACGFSLIFAIFIGSKSWLELTDKAGWVEHPGTRATRLLNRTTLTLALLAISILGWFRTEGTFEFYARYQFVVGGPSLYDQALATENVRFEAMEEGAFTAATVELKTEIHCRQGGPLCPSEGEIATGLSKSAYHVERAAELTVAKRWWMQTPFPDLLYPANLQNVVFVEKPKDWRSFATARAAYRVMWCKNEGLKPEVCGPAPGEISHVPDNQPYQPYQRLEWCRATFDKADRDPATVGALEKACADHFTQLDEQFREEWDTERSAARAALPDRLLTGRDLRHANLTGAQMEGADLIGAQMEGADLSFAQMEGAVLWGAQMEGADLSSAQIEGADLSLAQMEGADLWGAQMETADLSLVQMEGADLGEAQMEGANLWGAQMEGANLSKAQMEGADLSFAKMEGAVLRSAQMEGAVFWGAKMEGAVLSGAQMERAELTLAQFDAATTFTDVSAQSAFVNSVDFSLVPISPEQLSAMFGDASVILPGGKGPNDPEWPAHWPKEVLDYEAFQIQWRAWQASIGYTPPNSPAPPKSPQSLNLP